MEKKIMNVHEALAKIKLYDKKIEKAILNAKFSTYGKAKSKVLDDNSNKEEFKNESKASYDSITDMIDERGKIKSAIILSNAKTKITVAGEVMTVAEAIELKESIELRISLRNKMADDDNDSNAKVLYKNEDIEDKALRLVEGIDLSLKADEKIAQVNAYVENNKYEVVTFKDFKAKLEKLDTFIDDFLYEVDFALSSSNATTMIEI